MSFSEDCVRFGDQLAGLVDAGVAVKDAASALGISRQRCYAILRAIGRPVGSARAVARDVDDHVVAVFSATGSINQAAKACGVSHRRARRLLVAEGLVSDTTQTRGKPAAKRRFDELISMGWSAARAAREVGVHERTGRDWRDGIRKVGKTRIHPDGTVVDYRDGSRYMAAVTTTLGRRCAAADQYPIFVSAGSAHDCRWAAERADVDPDRRRDRKAQVDGVTGGSQAQCGRAVSAVSR